MILICRQPRHTVVRATLPHAVGCNFSNDVRYLVNFCICKMLERRAVASTYLKWQHGRRSLVACKLCFHVLEMNKLVPCATYSSQKDHSRPVLSWFKIMFCVSSACPGSRFQRVQVIKVQTDL
eukprot:4795377-Amphidinium_carterae.1